MKHLKRVSGVGVQTEMLVIADRPRLVAVIRDGGAREIEGAAAQVRHHLNAIGISRFLGADRNFERRNLDFRRAALCAKRLEQQFEVAGGNHRFVSLDVYPEVAFVWIAW